MPVPSERRFGAFTFVVGPLLLVIYASLFPFVLPIGPGAFDYVTVVASPWWRPLSAMAMAGVLLLLVGLDAVYSTFRSSSGIAAWIGFISLKVALVLQACKVTWELLLDPAIAKQPGAQFLFRDGVIFSDPKVVAFRWTAAERVGFETHKHSESRLLSKQAEIETIESTEFAVAGIKLDYEQAVCYPRIHACRKPGTVSAARSLVSASLEGTPMDPLQLRRVGAGIARWQVGKEITQHA